MGITASRCRPTRSRSSRPTRARWPRSRQLDPVRDPVRQRRRRLEPGPAAAPASSSPSTSFPVPGTHGAHLVLRRGRRAQRRGAPAQTRADAFTWDAARAAADELHRRHRRRARTACGPRRRPTSGRSTRPAPRVSYLTAPLRPNTTVLGAGAVRAWVRSSKPQRRPPGHDHRGPARRQGDLRAGRLAARQRAQARPAQEHAARAGPEPAQERRRAAAAQPLRRGDDPALLPGPRLPRRARASA